MQEYTRATTTVTAFQTPWNMSITVNGRTVAGLAGQWLVLPVGKDPYFMDDIEFEAEFTVVTPEPPIP